MGGLFKNTDKKRRLLADLSLFLVAIIWGGGFTVVKDTLDNMTPLYMNGIRFILAFVAMAILFWEKFIKINKKDLISGGIVGVFLFGGFVSQTIGLQYTTVSKSAFLTGTNVVIVPFLVWLINKKHPDWYAMAGAFLASVGIGLITLQGSFHIGIGDSLTLLCALLFAAHITSVGYFAKDIDPITLAMIQIGTTGIISIMGAFIFEPVPQLKGNIADICISISYMAFIATMGALLIQNVAQKHTLSTHAAIILSLESVFGTIFGVILLGDVLTLSMIIGCLLIFCAIIITETKLSFLLPRKKEDVTNL
ncbi:DMT family transporter [Crassaminicella thermophila]|uniref:DMT family transporter n=1 Tax=Crassaminicella thermophila TaxID=2599308 RepID=A0A5C0SAB6_CRATE|nr:DMT family transporter [Crassaminicella thermophila]QEK10927.1 DMT family transporter [Crassaminicella thermophila]